MMFPMSYTGFPYANRYRRSPYPQVSRPVAVENSHYVPTPRITSHVQNDNFATSIVQPQENNRDINDASWFDLFGIKLYFDDILIICLLFFLYTEGVKDQSLFIALIMLLLS